MAFASYAAFRIAFLQLVEGDDFAQSTFSVDVADTIIGLGESRVYLGDERTPGLRASSMILPLSQALTSNAAALPADLLELKELYFSGKAPLEIVELDRLRRYEADGYGGCDARWAAQNGDTLRFYPIATGTVLGSYYARPEALATVTWGDATTFARYPECFLYAALYEAMPFLGDDARIPLWEARYRQAVSGANHAEAMRGYGGSPLRMRAR